MKTEPKKNKTELFRSNFWQKTEQKQSKTHFFYLQLHKRNKNP
jgi:hypothetical protein